MLYQAAEFFNQPIATKLSNNFTLWIVSDNYKSIPKEWLIVSLPDKFHDYPTPQLMELDIKNIINKFQQQGDKNAYSKNNRIKEQDTIQMFKDGRSLY